MPLLNWFSSLTLKNRLFLAFIVLILLPFSVLDIYNFQKVKLNLQQKTSEQSLLQMNKMNESLESLLATTFKTITMFEQDSSVISVLKQPEVVDQIVNQRKIEERFRSVTNSLFISSPPVFYTIVDLLGNVYTSFPPAQRLNYEVIQAKPWFQSALSASAPYQWQLESNEVLFDVNKSPQLVAISTPIRDADGTIRAIIHIAVDYESWFKSATNGSPTSEQYYLIDQKGNEIVHSGANKSLMPLEAPIIDHLLTDGSSSGFFIQGSTFINYTVVPSFHAYLIKTVPSHVLFAELRSIQNAYMGTLIIFTIAFMIITFLIASAVTRPLRLIQAKMLDVVRKDLKVRLPDQRYGGDIQPIVQAFNQMIVDMNGLVQRLKVEERQKEASRFQMLLSQMNPHFLLNTLNTIRWLALEKGDNAIPKICVSLGRLTEAGLKLDVDLIHLEQELELVRGYIYIQQFRYDQQFQVDYVYADDLKYALVPKLSLQPIVENAIYHGISQIQEKGHISIHVFTKDSQLTLEVVDNGVGLEYSEGLSKKDHNGIALQNLRERLALLFKKEASLAFVPVSHGCMVRIQLPLLMSTPYQKGSDSHVDRSTR
ncbi:HAMP domain-containing protein [Paenibacillus sp. LMG 31461]|uniref:HAMP domain-containing protein n=1 Tax=Paenibacillus plantarum TaxID=2654975 RepID=A0ABX1XF51_9BACL|nr:sensor histidine kinase [Paenibacillus plantarum]NOU66530.1 HAMP domain-containing protein [Paenibacillus plantarum]